MKLKSNFITLTLFLFSLTCFSQNKTKLSGIITDYKNNPIKNVYIFIDSLKTSSKTNKKGEYKVDINKKNKMITAFSKRHGFINIEYTGQDKINFIFPESTKKISNKQFYELGYKKTKPVDYSNYSDIYTLLRSKFSNLKVNGDQIIINGGGTSLSSGPIPAAFIVNNVQVNTIRHIATTDIKKITVERTKSSIYGSRVGSGGIIKIDLK